jgi:hypothetical protein
MKKILVVMFVLFGANNVLKAQTDYCKDITKTVNGSSVIYMAPTPGDKKEESGVLSLAKMINETGINYYFRLGCSIDDPNNTITNVSVEFEDGDVLNFSNLTFKRGDKDIINNYLYSTTIPLSKEDFIKFKTKKFKTYTILGKKIYGGLGNPKVKLMAYANCLDSFTEGPAPVVNATEKKSIDGFWGIKFGATADEVKAAVIAKGGKLNADASKPDMLVFDNITFTGRAAELLRVNFVNGKFYEALVLFPPLDEGVVIGKFNTMVNELNDVYGPAKVYKKFEPPYDTGTGEYDVQAIKFGKGSYTAVWKTNNQNTIQLQIDKELGLQLYYSDSTLEKTKTITN